MRQMMTVTVRSSGTGAQAALQRAGLGDAAPLLAQLELQARPVGAGLMGDGLVDEHLALDLTAERPDLADVLYRNTEGPEQLAEVLTLYPACLVAALTCRDGGTAIGWRGGGRLLWRPGLSAPGVPAGVLGSLVHACLVHRLLPERLHTVALVTPTGSLVSTVEQWPRSGGVPDQPAAPASGGSTADSRPSATPRRSASGAPIR
ncbi:hypothetical protein ACFYNO_00975 [Kitasatospora sp. NPDC006697]|uniref:hypothetical protein n=1 Tax=Kitasatospora sp. NPDC006697 TaxID=3364020 RepID=UPI0036B3D16D